MNAAMTAHAVLDHLPEPLPTERIVALNRPQPDLHETRRYEWNGWEFDVPPAVFRPGGTSRLVHEQLLHGSIPVQGRRFAAMGAGLGVEAVVAGLRGAREVYVLDVHRESVDCAARHYARLVGDPPGTAFFPLVGDLFDALPAGTRLDVVAFNPPAVSQPVSDEPDVVRNVCAGTPLLQRFFQQVTDRDLLAPGGEVFVVASNTADLHGIVSSAVEHGLAPEIRHVHDWKDGVLTYLLRFSRGDRA